jgi:3-(3-hydroxy-phenyl)propionate hydroxylase
VSTRPVIVVGAGPVGLTVALSLAQQGVPVQVLEAEPGLTVDQRAGTFHPPTLEMLAPFGVTAEMHRIGIKVPRWQIRDRREGVIAEWDLGLIADLTAYPYRFHLEQHRLTPILFHKLHAFRHASVRFSTAFTEAVQDADGVTVHTSHGVLKTPWLVGCDGGRSVIRKGLGIEFEGFTWPERFIKIGTSFDFGSTGQGFCTRNYFSDPSEWLNLFKVKGNGPPGIWRGIMPVPPDESDEQALSMEGIQRRLRGIHAKDGDYEIPYYALYSVHQRVAATFNKGRVLLAGDSAHVNNPIGGMGMNGGIHDAMNLAEKLADVWFGRAEPDVLDRYTRQRRKAQVDYVQAQTIQNKKSLEERDPVTRRKHLDELRRISEDVKLHKQFLYRSALFDSLNSANAVE